MGREVRMVDIEIDVPDQLRDRVVRAAAWMGQSEQEFMLAAIAEKLERDEASPGEDIPDANRLPV